MGRLAQRKPGSRERLDPKKQSPEMCVENQPFRFWLSLAHVAQSERKPGGRRQRAAQNSERRFSTLALGSNSLGDKFWFCRLLAM